MSSYQDTRYNLSFPTAFLGLIISPNETAETLFTMERPKYALSVFVTFVLTFLIPMSIQQLTNDEPLYRPAAIQTIVVVIVVALALFVVTESIMLRFFGIKADLGVLASAICYSSVPFIFVIWIMYFLNYLASGSIEFLTFMLSGPSTQNSGILEVVPWAITVGLIISFRTYYNCIKHLGDLFGLNAFIIAVFSFAPAYGSLIAAVLIGESINPGTMDNFFEILTAPTTLMNV